MDDECKETLIEIARAIEERSPVIFMPLIPEYIRGIANMVNDRDLLIAELQHRLNDKL